MSSKVKKNWSLKVVGIGMMVSIVLFSGCSKVEENGELKEEIKLTTAAGTKRPKSTSTVDVSNGIVSENSSTETITSDTDKSIKVAISKKYALEILKNTVKIDKGLEFLDAALDENPDGTCKSGYKWDDGSYYAFTQGTKDAMGDIGSLFLVKKNTKDIFKLDLEKDIFGNILKKYHQ